MVLDHLKSPILPCTRSRLEHVYKQKRLQHEKLFLTLCSLWCNEEAVSMKATSVDLAKNRRHTAFPALRHKCPSASILWLGLHDEAYNICLSTGWSDKRCLILSLVSYVMCLTRPRVYSLVAHPFVSSSQHFHSGLWPTGERLPPFCS